MPITNPEYLEPQLALADSPADAADADFVALYDGSFALVAQVFDFIAAVRGGNQQLKDEKEAALIEQIENTLATTGPFIQLLFNADSAVVALEGA